MIPRSTCCNQQNYYCNSNLILSVILLQIVMVSPGTHLVKNFESHSRNIESQFKKQQVLTCLGLYVTRWIKLIFASYMGCMPYTFVHFGGFLCIKDAGQRGNKITVLILFFHYHHAWSLFCWYIQNLTREVQMKYISYTVTRA